MPKRTIEDVYSAVLDTKAEVLGLRGEMVTLREHVNDEVELMNKRINAQDAALDGKLDNGELLTSIGFRLANNRFIRWGIGIAATTTVGTVVVREWLPPFWVDVIQKLASLLG